MQDLMRALESMGYAGSEGDQETQGEGDQETQGEERPMSTDPSQPTINALPGKRVEALGACALIALTALLGLCWISELPLLGYDAYPLIASSQMEGLGDIWRILSMELMDGRYPDGHFHRPLVQLSFALDRTLHGLEPKGYHLTNLIACATSGVLIFGLARRVTGIGIWSACLAGLIFVAHPLQAEVLPFAARRADNLALCLILAVLALQVRPSTSLSWVARPSLWRARLVRLCSQGNRSGRRPLGANHAGDRSTGDTLGKNKKCPSPGVANPLGGRPWSARSTTGLGRLGRPLGL